MQVAVVDTDSASVSPSSASGVNEASGRVRWRKEQTQWRQLNTDAAGRSVTVDPESSVTHVDVVVVELMRDEVNMVVRQEAQLLLTTHMMFAQVSRGFCLQWNGVV